MGVEHLVSSDFGRARTLWPTLPAWESKIVAIARRSCTGRLIRQHEQTEKARCHLGAGLIEKRMNSELTEMGVEHFGQLGLRQRADLLVNYTAVLEKQNRRDATDVVPGGGSVVADRHSTYRS